MSIESYERMCRRNGVEPSSEGFFESGFVVDCPPSEDKARQEFKLEADISYQIERFKSGVPFPVGRSGEVDYSVDLMKAHELIQDAEQRYATESPEWIREKYRTYNEFWAAMMRGEIKAPAGAPASGAAGGASASDSAPVTPPTGG